MGLVDAFLEEIPNLTNSWQFFDFKHIVSAIDALYVTVQYYTISITVRRIVRWHLDQSVNS